MAIYALEVTAFSRSRGEAMIPKAAYRSATLLVDQSTGRSSDYRRRRGVEAAFMIFSHGLNMHREAVWNSVEAREIRRDSCVGREVRFALPAELSSAGRERCARRLGQYLVDKDDLFVDVAIHSANPAGDQRNWHVHALVPTRRMDINGNLTTKARHWDDPRLGPKTIKALREVWADIANEELALEGHVGVHLDARSNKARGIDARPGVKMGLAATAIERRTGSPSDKRVFSQTPIEIDLDVVAAVRAFEAAMALQRMPVQPQQAAPPQPSIDVHAVLARLRDGARRNIKRHLKTRLPSMEPAGTPAAGTARPPQLQPATASFARRRRSSVTLVRDAIHQRPAHSGRFTPPGKGVSRNAVQPSVPPRDEALDMTAWHRAFAFAIAAAEAAGEATSEEIAAFTRRAINVVARDLNLPPTMIEAEIASYRMLSRPHFEKILATV